MTLIPVNPSDYPTEQTPLDTSRTYRVQIKSLELAAKRDKNGNEFMKLTAEVLEPELYRGRVLTANYIPIPAPITEGMSEWEENKAKNDGVQLSRLVQCFNIKAGPDGLDTASAIGCIGTVGISEGEYQGRKTYSIRDFLLTA